MTARERFLKVLNFEKPEDRLPLIEWAAWWPETTDSWKEQGFPKDISWEESLDYFNLDKMFLLYGFAMSDQCPQPSQYGMGIIKDENDYEKIRPFLYQDSNIDKIKKRLHSLRKDMTEEKSF